MSDAADPAAYIAAVLTLYVDLPDTPLRASVSDQWLARRYAAWFAPQRPHGSPPSDPWPTSGPSLTNSRRIDPDDSTMKFRRARW